MAKTRGAYPPEFRRQMVELVHAGRTPEELAHEFEPTAQSIRNWVAQCPTRRLTQRRAAGAVDPPMQALVGVGGEAARAAYPAPSLGVGRLGVGWDR